MKLIFSILFFIIFNFSNAQERKYFSASLTPIWRMGEKKVLTITRSKREFKEGKLSSNFLLTIQANISVIDSTSEGYTIQWVFHLTDQFKKDNPNYETEMGGYDGLTMIFKTNEDGSFKELVNWKEVKDSYLKMFEATLPKDMDATTRASIDKSNSLFNSKEMVEATLIKELKIYHSPFGGTFYTDEVNYETSIPSPFGGENFPAISSQKISSFDLSKKTYKVVITQKIDSLNVVGLMQGLIKKWDISPKSDSSLNLAKKELLGWKSNDYSEFEIDQNSGWVTRLTYTRTVIGSGNKSTETFLMKLK